MDVTRVDLVLHGRLHTHSEQGRRLSLRAQGSKLAGGGQDAAQELQALLIGARHCSDVLSPFDDTGAALLAKHFAAVPYAAGEEIIRAGEPASFFGLVLRGAVAPVLSSGPDGALEVRMEQQSRVGAPVGEMALFTGGR